MRPGAATWLPGLILAAYLLLAAGYSLGTPPWEAPDEPAHYLYAEHLAAYGALPPAAPPQRGHYWEGGYVTSPYEWHQPPLYYALVAPQIALVNALKAGTIPQAFPPVDPGFPEQARNLFSTLPDPSFAAPGLRLARWFSVALGLGTLWATYRAAILASGGDRAVALAATGMMAFIPQYTFLSGYVTNDNLALLLSALCLLAFLRLLGAEREREELWRVAGAGALVALALYTKLSLLFLLPCGLFCLLLRLARHRSAGQWLRESAALAGAAILPLLLGLLALPGLRAQAAHAYASLQPQAEFLSWEYLAGLWPPTYTSFWGKFGWMNVSTPRWIANTWTLITAAGLSGSAALLLRGKRRRQAPALLWAACGLVAVGFLQFNLAVRQPQGRLLFAALPALVILVALGTRQLTGRWYPLVGGGVVLFSLAANLICLFGALLPAYAPPI